MHINEYLKLSGKISDKLGYKCMFCGEELLAGDVDDNGFTLWCNCGFIVGLDKSKNVKKD